nr:MAG TPA: hypothetical protein [Caudoviricetes sp.]
MKYFRNKYCQDFKNRYNTNYRKTVNKNRNIDSL